MLANIFSGNSNWYVANLSGVNQTIQANNGGNSM